HLAPLRRDGGHLCCRSRGGRERRPDQDRLRRAQRAHRQVQSAAAHRGRARPRRLMARAQPLLPHRPVSGRPRALGVAAILIVAAGLGAYGVRGLLRVSEMRREMDTMERDLVTLRARTDELTKTVERLRSDPAYIEKLAREDLGYVREGETRSEEHTSELQARGHLVCRP